MISWQHYLIKRSKLKHFDKEGSICPLCKERWDTIFEIIMCLLSILTKHGQKQWKTFENHEKSTFSIMRTRGSWRKIIFECFLLFLTMGTHAQANVSWLKYTTSVHSILYNSLRLTGCWLLFIDNATWP